MTGPTVRIDDSGAVIDTATATLDLIAATALPDGGVLSVDLLRPERPYALVLTAAQLRDERTSRYVEVIATQLRDTGATVAQLPDTWLRLVLVAGVNRWSLTDLDPDLIVADHAQAAALAGDPHAGGLFAAAEPRLRTLVDGQLALGDQRAPALVGELQQILDTAADYSTDLANLRKRSQRLGMKRGATSAAAVQLAPVSSLGPQTPRRADPPRPRHILDPLRIPARLLAGIVETDRRSAEEWQIRCPVGPRIHSGHPALSRLLVRAVDRDSGALMALGPLAFDAAAGELAATIRLPDVPADQIVIDVFDSLSSGWARYSDAETIEIEQLRAAQTAFTLLREALSARRLRDPEAARTRIQLARLMLPEAAGTGELAAQLDAVLAGSPDDGLPASVTGTGAARPLLCELTALAG